MELRMEVTKDSTHFPKRESQPGLEVNIHAIDHPIVVHSDKEVYLSPHDPLKQRGLPPYDIPPTRPLWRRKRFIFGILALIIVIVGATVGGVVGSRGGANSSSSPGPGSPQGNDSPDTGGGNATAAIALSMREGSRLAATGYRTSKEFVISLFYQGQDQKLRQMLFRSEFDAWSKPLDIATSAVEDTPLTVSELYWLPPENSISPHQTELFYISAPGVINGHNFFANADAAGGPDSIGTENRFKIDSKSDMGSYFPTIVSQEATGSLTETIFDFSGFVQRDLGLKASPGSPIAVLPATTRHSLGVQQNVSTVRIVYRDTGGKLTNFDRDINGTRLPSSGSLSLSIPDKAPIAAFATGRAAGSSDVSTWVLYQETDGTINYTFLDSGSKWKGPVTDDVFKGANKPTKMACVTPGSSTVPDIPLEASFDMSRCFFLVGRAVKQVEFDGSRWKDLGFVPLP